MSYLSQNDVIIGRSIKTDDASHLYICRINSVKYCSQNKMAAIMHDIFKLIFVSEIESILKSDAMWRHLNIIDEAYPIKWYTVEISHKLGPPCLSF